MEEDEGDSQQTPKKARITTPETIDGDTGAVKDNSDEEALLPQEVKELALQAKAKAVQLMHLKHLLKSIVNNPPRFKDPEFRFVREVVTIVENHRDKYPHVMGYKQYNEYIQAVTDDTSNNNKMAVKLTSGYVLAVSRAEDTSLFPGKPILHKLRHGIHFTRTFNYVLN
jgi:hypothetical protein